MFVGMDNARSFLAAGAMETVRRRSEKLSIRLQSQPPVPKMAALSGPNRGQGPRFLMAMGIG